MEQIYHIYDRIFKRIFNLSNLAIINLINGLFQTNYPLDSEVIYPNKEFINSSNQSRFADVLIVINKNTYHLEAQMAKDDTIVLRAFEYGFMYAMENRSDDYFIEFPEPVIIYLDDIKDMQPKDSISIHFKGQGVFEYKVHNFIYQEHDTVELNQRKMVILIPFKLLKLRKIIAKEPSKENFQKLKNLIEHDILDSIKANYQVGNISVDDANQLWELTEQLYEHIYANYEKLGGYEEMKPLLEGALELPMDKYRIRIDELETENAKVSAENAKVSAENAKVSAENAKMNAELVQLKQQLAEFQQQLAELQKK